MFFFPFFDIASMEVDVSSAQLVYNTYNIGL